MSDETPAMAITRLRTRLVDLQRVGLMDPQSFGTYQQTILHILQECERRAVTCAAEAESYRAKAMAAEHQAGAFKMMSSIIGAVVNAYVEKAETSAREAAEHAKEKAEQEAAVPPPSAPPAAPEAPAAPPAVAPPSSPPATPRTFFLNEQHQIASAKKSKRPVKKASERLARAFKGGKKAR